MRTPEFKRDGARFIVDQGHLGRFEYHEGIEARSIVAVEKVLSESLSEDGMYSIEPSEVICEFTTARNGAALKLMEVLSVSVIGPGPTSIRQLQILQKWFDELIVVMLASIRPLPSKINIEGSAEARV